MACVDNLFPSFFHLFTLNGIFVVIKKKRKKPFVVLELLKQSTRPLLRLFLKQ